MRVLLSGGGGLGNWATPIVVFGSLVLQRGVSVTYSKLVGMTVRIWVYLLISAVTALPVWLLTQVRDKVKRLVGQK